MRRIPSLPGYYATEGGEILGVRSNRPLTARLDRYGYLVVKAAGKNRKVHRLVCEAYHGPCPDGHECGHLNGNKRHNHPDNLAWVTRKENTHHQIEHGVFNHLPRAEGERHGAAKLTADDVRRILARVEAGESRLSVAKSYGLSHSYVGAIVSGKRWGHLTRRPSHVSLSRPCGFQSTIAERGR